MGSRSEGFGDGLAWVTAPLEPGSEVRIVSPRFPGQGQEEHFEIHDYVATSWAPGDRLLLGQARSWILHRESITADDLLRIAATAESRRDRRAAIAVYDRVVERYGDAPEPALREPVTKARSLRQTAL
jgi:hypothetical protein